MRVLKVCAAKLSDDPQHSLGIRLGRAPWLLTFSTATGILDMPSSSALHNTLRSCRYPETAASLTANSRPLKFYVTCLHQCTQKLVGSLSHLLLKEMLLE